VPFSVSAQDAPADQPYPVGQESDSSGNLTQPGLNSQSQKNVSDNSKEIMDALSNLFRGQSSDLRTLRTQWHSLINLVETYSTVSKNETDSLKTLLLNSGETIKSLESNLETAIDRINDAEEGALNLLDENIRLYDDGKKKDEKILKLTETNGKQLTAIFIMAGIMAAVLAFFIVKFILWIKGGAAASLIKNFCRRVT
jgi:hypothetical protein